MAKLQLIIYKVAAILKSLILRAQESVQPGEYPTTSGDQGNFFTGTT